MIDWVRVEERIRRSTAYWWAIARAVAALLRPGVAVKAQRRLIEDLRSRPDVRPHLRGAWLPAWLGPMRRYPIHVVLLGALLATGLALIGLTVAGGENTVGGVVCGGGASDACARSLAGTLGVMLAAQVTLLALIFPLTVTLLPPLLGSRISTSARGAILVFHTELEAAGLSALALAVALSVLLIGTDMLPQGLWVASAAWAMLWFALNMVSTGFFLGNALSLLDPNRRLDATLSYAVHVLTEDRPTPRLEEETLEVSSKDDCDDQRSDRPLRETFSYKVRIEGAESRVLTEIRDRALRAVLQAVHVRTDGEARIRPRGGNDVSSEDLGLGFEDQRTDSSVVVASSCPLTPLERWLFRRCYRFSRRKPKPPQLPPERLSEELVVDAWESLVRDDPDLKTRLQHVAELHGLLLKISVPVADKSPSRVFARERGPTRFGNLPDLSNRAYLQLLESAAARLPNTQRSFPAVVRLPLSIASASAYASPPEAFASVDRLLAYLAYRLFDRGAREAAVITADGGVARGPMPLPAAAVDWYDEAWRTLSAAWTDLLADRLITAGRAASDLPPDRAWAAWQAESGPLRRHLESTTRFVAKAAALGDAIGGGRTLDLLLAWPHEIDLRVGFGREIPLIAYPGADLGVSPTLLHRSDWAEVEKTVTAPPLDFLRQLQPARVVETALLNAWSDGCLALAVVLAEFALQAGPNSVAARLLRNLCRGAFHDPHPTPSAAGSPAALPPLRPDIVLRTVAAIVSRRDEARGGLIEDLLRRLREAAEPPMVSGRVYSGWGLSNRLDDAHQGLALLLLALAVAGGEWQPSPSFPEELNLFQAGPTDEGVVTFLTKVAAATTAPSDELLRTLAGAEDVETASLAKARQCVRVTCRLLARRLRRRTERVQKTAPLDPARLDAIAQAAGSLAFRKDTAAPPVSLFSQLADDATEQEHAVFLPASFRRGALTRPLLDTPSLNEAEFWAQAMRDEVAMAVLRVLLSRISRRLSLASPEAWRDALIAWRKSIGGEAPLLLWGRNWPTAWTLDRGVGGAIAARLNNPSPPPDILARTPFLDGVRIVPVVRGAPTLLAPASMFRRLTFGATEGKPVTLEVEDRKDAQDQVRLTLRASFSLALDRPERALILKAVADHTA